MGVEKELREDEGPVSIVKRVYGIVLAAGPGTRYEGGRYKLLLPFRGEPLVAHVVRNALDSRLEQVNVVVGHQREEVMRALLPFMGDRRLLIEFNAAYLSGRASTVRCGLGMAPKDAEYAMFLTADMPLVGADLINRLIREVQDHPEAPMYFPVFEGEKGNPIVYSRRMFEELAAIQGDTSGYELVQKHFKEAHKLPLKTFETQINVNTLEDYKMLVELEHPAPRVHRA